MINIGGLGGAAAAAGGEGSTPLPLEALGVPQAEVAAGDMGDTPEPLPLERLRAAAEACSS